VCKHYKTCGHDLCPVDNPDDDIYCDEWEQKPEDVTNPCCLSGQVVVFNSVTHCVRCKKVIKKEDQRT
jgi:hypothetical protein